MIDKFAYVLDLENDVEIFTAEKIADAPKVMLLMMEHGALGCRVYNTNFKECMSEWKLLTVHGGVEAYF